MSHSLPPKLKHLLAQRAHSGLLRTPKVLSGVDFMSNDYFGWAKQVDTGTGLALGGTGSRLISGHTAALEVLEQRAATDWGGDQALFFPSGYAANIGFFASVPQRGDVVLADAHVHASIVDGLRLSMAHTFKFAHNDLNDLNAKAVHARAKMHPDGVLFVVTEGLFSMDGDFAPLSAMADWCAEFGAYLVVDEAHSTGVYGERGGGLVQDLGLEDKVWARLLTLGKAMGRQGAFWLVDQPLKSFLVNYARSLIYSTAPSPAEVAHITQTLILAQERGPQARAQLRERIEFFRDTAQNLGVLDHLWPAFGPIQAWKCPSHQSAVLWAEQVQQSGFGVKAILPPTVPEGTARLRLCIHADHTDEEIGGLLSALKQCL